MKKNRGAITIITLTTILFMLAFLIGAYTIVMNRRQVQAEIKKKTKDIYQNDVKNAEQIYQGYFAGDEEIVPVWTVGNLLKVCKIIQEDSEGYIFSKGKIYKCTASSNYKLENDLNLNDMEYIDQYSELFEERKWIKSEITTASNTIVTGTRWKGILETANFDFGDKIIRETDSKNNVLEHRKINAIEYIESTGTQWIDTNIYPTSQTTVKVKFNMTAPTGGIIVGFYNNEGDSFRFFNYSNNAYLDYGSGAGYNRISGGTVTSGTIYNIEFGNRYVKNIDTNTNIISGTAVSFSDKTISIKIFGDSSDLEKASGKIYYLQIYINDILARDYVPVLDSNNVPCLYDKISKTYFYNSGTGVLNYK